MITDEYLLSREGVSLESSEICVPLGIGMEVRKLVGRISRGRQNAVVEKAGTVV